MLLSAWHFFGVNKTPKIKQNKTVVSMSDVFVTLIHQSGVALPHLCFA